MTNVVHLKGTRDAPRSARSTMETQIISVAAVLEWRVPSFQRPLRVNPKVLAIAKELKDHKAIELGGVLTLGRVGSDKTLYIVDGQHRIEAFKISGLDEIIADIRLIVFEDEAEMATEFVRLNSALVRMRPDDILRGMESTSTWLQMIRAECPFVGYGSVRRNASVSGPVLGMAALLRAWHGSQPEVPVTNSAGVGTLQLAARLDEESTNHLIDFLGLCHSAWGRDPEHYRLWSALNITICAWLYRRLVLDRVRTGNKRYVVVSPTMFQRCLMALAANGHYLAFLVGRSMSDRDRSPCFGRVKVLFAARIAADSKESRKPMLPQPDWAS